MNGKGIGRGDIVPLSLIVEPGAMSSFVWDKKPPRDIDVNNIPEQLQI
jgi:hypothetical protein